MKITVDFDAAMRSAMNNVLKDTNYPTIELELIDTPTDFLQELSIISQEYKDEFWSAVETEFNANLTKNILDQFSKNGINIDDEDSQ